MAKEFIGWTLGFNGVCSDPYYYFYQTERRGEGSLPSVMVKVLGELGEKLDRLFHPGDFYFITIVLEKGRHFITSITWRGTVHSCLLEVELSKDAINLLKKE